MMELSIGTRTAEGSKKEPGLGLTQSWLLYPLVTRTRVVLVVPDHQRQMDDMVIDKGSPLTPIPWR